jgi:hypothetical protein
VTQTKRKRKEVTVLPETHRKLSELASRTVCSIQDVIDRLLVPAVDKAHAKAFGDDATASK